MQGPYKSIVIQKSESIRVKKKIWSNKVGHNRKLEHLHEHIAPLDIQNELESDMQGFRNKRKLIEVAPNEDGYVDCNYMDDGCSHWSEKIYFDERLVYAKYERLDFFLISEAFASSSEWSFWLHESSLQSSKSTRKKVFVKIFANTTMHCPCHSYRRNGKNIPQVSCPSTRCYCTGESLPPYSTSKTITKSTS